MCGRYEFKLDGSDKYTKQITTRIEELNIEGFKMGEIFPNDNCLVFVGKDNNKVDLDIKHWGIPLKSLLINARMESLNEKKIYKDMSRCIIIANGFYEWKDKEKYYIRKDDPFIYLGGLYDKDNNFVIITGDSNNDMKLIHHRSPVIFNQNEMINYLHNKKEVYINDTNLLIDLV